MGIASQDRSRHDRVAKGQASGVWLVAVHFAHIFGMSACAVRNLRLLGRRAFAAGKHFIDAQAGHVIGDETLHEIEHELDLEETLLRR